MRIEWNTKERERELKKKEQKFDRIRLSSHFSNKWKKRKSLLSLLLRLTFRAIFQFNSFQCFLNRILFLGFSAFRSYSFYFYLLLSLSCPFPAFKTSALEVFPKTTYKTILIIWLFLRNSKFDSSKDDYIWTFSLSRSSFQNLSIPSSLSLSLCLDIFSSLNYNEWWQFIHILFVFRSR